MSLNTNSAAPAAPLRAVAYLRLSKSSDHLDDTITRQRQDTLAYCKARGYIVVDVCEDGGISAYEGRHDRPGYNRLLDLISAGEVDRVVCYNVDRLHRSTRQLLEYMELTKARGVITEATQGSGLNPMSSDGVLLATILGSVAQAESSRKAERVTRAKLQAVESGVFQQGGRYRAYGWTRAGEVIDAEAEVVRYAAAQLLDGRSLRSISRDLTAQGATTVTGGRMDPQALRRILRHPRTAGLSSWSPADAEGRHSEDNRVILGPGQWEPLVDRETWEAVVALLNNPARATNKAGTEPRHLLTGHARCSVCGGKMVTVSDGKASDGTPLRTYKCSGTGDGRRHVTRRVRVLDPYVTAVVHNVLVDLDVGRYLQGTDDRDDAAVASLVARRDELEGRMADLEASLASVTGGAVAVITRAVGKVAEELETVTAALAEANQGSGGSAVTTMAGATTLEAVQARWEGMDAETRRRLVRELVTVTIHPARPGRGGFDPDLVDVELTARAAGAVRE